MEEVYPPGFQTYVTVEEVTRPLEGAARPTHFRGVATVVAKLFNVFQPDRAYFGQKDAQQAVVIRQMARDLDFPLEVVICPIVREPDGLALSSRNVYLTPEQRAAAPVLNRALRAARDAWQAGEHDGERLRGIMRGVLAAEPLARPDYVERRRSRHVGRAGRRGAWGLALDGRAYRQSALDRQYAFSERVDWWTGRLGVGGLLRISQPFGISLHRSPNYQSARSQSTNDPTGASCTVPFSLPRSTARP